MAQQYDLPSKKGRTELKAPPPVSTAQPPVPTAPVRGDPRGLAGFIRETAAKYGISPEVALRVAQSEGLAQFSSGVRRPDGSMEPSFGAFQLYTGGGLGNQFQKDTGLDPSDPANEKATIEYALKHAAANGWGPWYGAKRAGIGNFEGIAFDPTPNVGSGASDYVADTASATTPSDDSSAKKDKKKDKYSEAAGEGFEALSKSFAEGPAAKNAARASGPSTLPAPSMPTPVGPIPMIDTRLADMQRQQLALAMQRLNSGRLV
jgi:hypothetical protein